MKLYFDTVRDFYKGDPEIVSLLDRCEVFECSNVAEYFFSTPEKDIDWTDFPNIAPPFEFYFMEFRLPEIFPMPWARGMKMGVLFGSKRNQEPEGWDMEGHFYFGPRVATSIKTKYFVNKDGSFHITDVSCFYDDEEVTKEYAALMLDVWIKKIFAIGLLATSLLHCKNVTQIENKPHKNPNTKRNRHGCRITFKTLNIKPMTNILRDEGGAEREGLPIALHICRGHFKTYSGKGLFGKYQGTYWWESQVRGKVENGVVVKDYSVDKPEGVQE